jgi:hypothetical protein
MKSVLLISVFTPLVFVANVHAARSVCENLSAAKSAPQILLPEQRASVFCRFKESLFQKYALWDLKK